MELEAQALAQAEVVVEPTVAQNGGAGGEVTAVVRPRRSRWGAGQSYLTTNIMIFTC